MLFPSLLGLGLILCLVFAATSGFGCDVRLNIGVVTLWVLPFIAVTPAETLLNSTRALFNVAVFPSRIYCIIAVNPLTSS